MRSKLLLKSFAKQLCCTHSNLKYYLDFQNTFKLFFIEVSSNCNGFSETQTFLFEYFVKQSQIIIIYVNIFVKKTLVYTCKIKKCQTSRNSCLLFYTVKTNFFHVIKYIVADFKFSS